MALSGIGGQSGFSPAQAAAQYYRNATGGTEADGRMSQARKEAAALEESRARRRESLLGTGDRGQQFGASTKSSINSVVYDPRDTNGDGKVSSLEEFSYNVKQYGAGDIGESSESKKAETAEESGAIEESSSNYTVYDPKDTNRDGKVSLQEEIAYAARQYRAGSAGDKVIPPSDDSNEQRSQYSSISLQA
jgi:hypothetical protein